MPTPTMLIPKGFLLNIKYWWGGVTTGTIKMKEGEERWNLCTFYFPANSPLGIKDRKTLPCVYKKSYIKMWLQTHTQTKNGKKSKCPITREEINKKLYINVAEYYVAKNMN